MRFRYAVVVSTIFAVGVVIGSMLNRPTEAQQPANRSPGPAPQVGRFQMRVNVGSDSRVVVTDTTTGQTWTHAPSGGPTWVDFGVPSTPTRR